MGYFFCEYVNDVHSPSGERAQCADSEGGYHERKRNRRQRQSADRWARSGSGFESRVCTGTRSGPGSTHRSAPARSACCGAPACARASASGPACAPAAAGSCSVGGKRRRSPAATQWARCCAAATCPRRSCSRGRREISAFRQPNGRRSSRSRHLGHRVLLGASRVHHPRHSCHRDVGALLSDLWAERQDEGGQDMRHRWFGACRHHLDRHHCRGCRGCVRRPGSPFEQLLFHHQQLICVERCCG